MVNMTRILRLSLLTLAVCTFGSSAFAFCRICNDQGICERLIDSGTSCIQHIDYCQEFVSGCTGLADNDTLADQLAIASVEVTTPAGVTKSDAAPRVAQLTALP